MKKDWHQEEFRTLVTLGESTTAGGWSSTRERCWASQLARLINEFQRTPLHLVNVGIGANLISTGSPHYDNSGKPAASERLDKHVLAHEPDLLIISYGLNDARGGTPIEFFCDEIVDLLRRVRERLDPAPLIVLLGPYYMNDFTLGAVSGFGHGSLELFYDYNDATRKVAETHDCLFADVLNAYDNADWLVHRDGCHANDVGHRIVANRIFEVLASNCSGLARETRHLEEHIPPWRDESTLRADYGYQARWNNKPSGEASPKGSTRNRP